MPPTITLLFTPSSINIKKRSEWIYKWNCYRFFGQISLSLFLFLLQCNPFSILGHLIFHVISFSMAISNVRCSWPNQVYTILNLLLTDWVLYSTRASFEMRHRNKCQFETKKDNNKTKQKKFFCEKQNK